MGKMKNKVYLKLMKLMKIPGLMDSQGIQTIKVQGIRKNVRRHKYSTSKTSV